MLRHLKALLRRFRRRPPPPPNPVLLPTAHLWSREAARLLRDREKFRRSVGLHLELTQAQLKPPQE